MPSGARSPTQRCTSTPHDLFGYRSLARVRQLALMSDRTPSPDLPANAARHDWRMCRDVGLWDRPHYCSAPDAQDAMTASGP